MQVMQITVLGGKKYEIKRFIKRRIRINEL